MKKIAIMSLFSCLFTSKVDLLSIEYVPKTGKNRGKIYEQFYKGDKCRLFVWLKDTSEIIDGCLYKKDLQGAYWDMNAWMKNLTKKFQNVTNF